MTQTRIKQLGWPRNIFSDAAKQCLYFKANDATTMDILARLSDKDRQLLVERYREFKPIDDIAVKRYIVYGSAVNLIRNALERFSDLPEVRKIISDAKVVNESSALVNYSTIPLAKWGDKMLQDTKRYNKIVDIPCEHEWQNINNKTMATIIQQIVSCDPVTVMIWLEDSLLAYGLVSRLKSRGIPVIGPVLRINESGQREFVEFKEYN